MALEDDVLDGEQASLPWGHHFKDDLWRKEKAHNHSDKWTPSESVTHIDWEDSRGGRGQILNEDSPHGRRKAPKRRSSLRVIKTPFIFTYWTELVESAGVREAGSKGWPGESAARPMKVFIEAVNQPVCLTLALYGQQFKPTARLTGSRPNKNRDANRWSPSQTC